MSIEIDGFSALQTKIDAISARTRDLKPPLLRAGIVALKAAQDRIDAGGPGWAPNKSGTPLLHQTGRLLSSLTVGGQAAVNDLNETDIVVGTNVQYAAYLQKGTGLFGPTGTPITSKSGGPLVFTIGGRKIFARSTQGTPARPFLFIDEQIAERVRDIFATYILQGAKS